jgi:hypothetical protein
MVSSRHYVYIEHLLAVKKYPRPAFKRRASRPKPGETVLEESARAAAASLQYFSHCNAWLYLSPLNIEPEKGYRDFG